MKRAVLKPKREFSVRKRHPWVFSGAIKSISGEVAEGDLVRVESCSHEFLALGHYQIGSIAIRIISFEDVSIDRAFFTKRIENAYGLRRALVTGDTNAYRLIHGEGDCLPGLVVDVYNDTAVLQAHSVGMHTLRTLLAEIIVEVVPEVSKVYYKSEGTMPHKAPVEVVDGYLIGSYDESDEIAVENGLKFHADWLEGQKTGFFLDQKYNRQAAARLAHGKRVLDCFTHTGAFALNCAAAGAEHVTAVDISSLAIGQTKKNAEMNGLTDKMSFVEADVFELLTFLAEKKRGEYDYIILDPPAFTKSSSTVKDAFRGYKDINMRAMRSLPRGGYLATCSCSHFMVDELFRKMLAEAAHDAGVSLRQIEARTQSPDHPILWNVPETDYLKFYLFQLV